MVRDLLEDCAYELERVSEMFAMPDLEYETHLRKLGREILEYRQGIIEALEKLSKIDKEIYDQQLNEEDIHPFWDEVIFCIDLLLGVRFNVNAISTSN